MQVLKAVRLLPHLMSPLDRARAFGARVEVCGFLVARAPRVALLVVQSQYGPWMPIQEGVAIGETLEHALWRGLREEAGIDVSPEDRGNLVNDQGCVHLGTLRLDRERWDRGVRPVAPGLPEGHPLALVRMRKKAYWGLFRQVADYRSFDPVPNGTEVVAAEWVSLAEARRRVEATVTPRKRPVLLKGLDISERAASGTALHIADF